MGLATALLHLAHGVVTPGVGQALLDAEALTVVGRFVTDPSSPGVIVDRLKAALPRRAPKSAPPKPSFLLTPETLALLRRTPAPIEPVFLKPVVLKPIEVVRGYQPYPSHLCPSSPWPREEPPKPEQPKVDPKRIIRTLPFPPPSPPLSPAALLPKRKWVPPVAEVVKEVVPPETIQPVFELPLGLGRMVLPQFGVVWTGTREITGADDMPPHCAFAETEHELCFQLCRLANLDDTEMDLFNSLHHFDEPGAAHHLCEALSYYTADVFAFSRNVTPLPMPPFDPKPEDV